jgi:hypothetical protein
MDDKAQMYVYESIIVAMMMVIAISFIAATAPEPTISYSSRLNQIETIGTDALRLADELGILQGPTLTAIKNQRNIGSDDALIEYLDNTITEYIMGTSYAIKVDDFTCYQTSEIGDSTVSSHRIVVDTSNGALYDVTLLIWYNTN